MNNVKQIIAYGECRDSIKEFADKNNFECKVFETLEESTKEAYILSLEGDIILLSPACASFDQFVDFEDRGSKFKEAVRNLK